MGVLLPSWKVPKDHAKTELLINLLFFFCFCFFFIFFYILFKFPKVLEFFKIRVIQRQQLNQPFPDLTFRFKFPKNKKDQKIGKKRILHKIRQESLQKVLLKVLLRVSPSIPPSNTPNIAYYPYVNIFIVIYLFLFLLYFSDFLSFSINLKTTTRIIFCSSIRERRKY